MVAKKIEAGVVWINRYIWYPPVTQSELIESPQFERFTFRRAFRVIRLGPVLCTSLIIRSGVKQSGIGRECGESALANYTHSKAIYGKCPRYASGKLATLHS